MTHAPDAAPLAGSRVMPPLNDRLTFINEDGSRRERVIASVIAARLAKDSLPGASKYVESLVDGELQIYHQRRLIRELGCTTVSDMLAGKEREGLRKAAGEAA